MKLTIKILKDFLTHKVGLNPHYTYYRNKSDLIEYIAKHNLEDELKSYLKSL